MSDLLTQAINEIENSFKETIADREWNAINKRFKKIKKKSLKRINKDPIDKEISNYCRRLFYFLSEAIDLYSYTENATFFAALEEKFKQGKAVRIISGDDNDIISGNSKIYGEYEEILTIEIKESDDKQYYKTIFKELNYDPTEAIIYLRKIEIIIFKLLERLKAYVPESVAIDMSDFKLQKSIDC